MDDINVYVAQRATLFIGTIHDTAIEVMTRIVVYFLNYIILSDVCSTSVAPVLPGDPVRPGGGGPAHGAAVRVSASQHAER